MACGSRRLTRPPGPRMASIASAHSFARSATVAPHEALIEAPLTGATIGFGSWLRPPQFLFGSPASCGIFHRLAPYRSGSQGCCSPESSFSIPIQLSVRIHVRSCCSSQSSCTLSHSWAETSAERPSGPSVLIDGDGGVST